MSNDASKPNDRREESTAEKLRKLTTSSGGAESTGENVDNQSPDSAVPGRPHYIKIAPIAEGGMGEVIKYKDTNLGREIAVKVLKRDLAGREEILARFVEEAQVGGQLQHPGIVPVYDLGWTADRRPYFAMKLIQGVTLKELLAKRASPEDDRRRFFTIFEQVCQTAGYAHARGVIHRDLKPSNIMVGAFGEVQIVDWGLAKVYTNNPGAGSAGAAAPVEPPVTTIRTEDTNSGVSLSGTVMGTPPYMPPEQALGLIEKLNPRSDVFSLGSILCEILTNTPAYGGQNAGVVLGRAARGELKDAYDRLDACGADAELIYLTKRCLQKEMAARPANAKELADAVASYLSSVEERARKAQIAAAEARVRAASERKARNLTMALAFFIVATAGIGGGGYLWVRAERDVRNGKMDREVAAAIEEASGERIKKDWARAVSAAERANSLLKNSENPPDGLAARAAAVLREVTKEAGAARALDERNRKYNNLTAALESIRYPESARFREGDWALVDRQYFDAFVNIGIDLNHNNLNQTVEWMAELGRSAEVAAWLDVWTGAARRAFHSARVLQLASISSKLDPDPGRVSLRASMLQNDNAAILAFASKPELADWPATTLILLGNALLEPDRRAIPEAVSVLKLAIAKRPDDFSANAALAVALGKSRSNLSEAKAYYRAAVALRPKNSEIMHTFGSILEHTHRDYKSAEDCFRSAVAVSPNDAHVYMHLGNVARNAGRGDEAILLLKKSLESNKNDGDCLGALADYYSSIKDYKTALEYAREGIRLNPEHEKLRTGIVYIYFYLNDISEAERVARSVVADLNKSAEAHAALGFILDRQGKRKEAFVEFKEANTLDPTHAAAARNLAMSYIQYENDPVAGMKVLTDLSAVAAPTGAEYRLLAEAHQALGQYESAVASMRQAVLLNPRDAGIREYYGILLHNISGNVQEAILQLKEAVALDPASSTAHSKYSYMLAAAGRFDEALDHAREGVALAPKNGIAHYHLGYVYYRRAEYAAAIESLMKAEEFNYTELLVYSCLLECYKYTRDTNRLLEAARGAVARHPKAVEFLYILGYAEADAGDYRESVDAFERILNTKNIRPSEPWAGMAFSYARAGDSENATKFLAKARDYINKFGASGPAMARFTQAEAEVAKITKKSTPAKK